MEHGQPDSVAAGSIGASKHPCPKCGGDLARIPRRLTDRLTSLLLPKHRYRCYSFSCQWEGNIRVDRAAANKAPPKR